MSVESDAIDLAKQRAQKRRAAEEEPNAEETARLVLNRKAPHHIAGAFMNQRYMCNGARTLLCYNGDFYRWEKTHYALAEGAGITAELYDFLARARVKSGSAFKPTRADVENIVHALRSVAYLAANTTPPTWLDDGPAVDGSLLACTNGVLQLSDYELLGHTPHLFNTWAVEFDYDPEAPEPVEWLRFLKSLWHADKETIETLQEMFGYILAGGNEQQKLFLLIGPKRSGKGTIARVLERLVGRGNYAGLTLASLGNNFGLQPLIGKSLAIVPDARLSGRSHEVVERLLAISGGDPLTVDRKHREHWTGQITARIVFLTNVLPKLADSSGAIASRFIILAFTESFFGKEDHGLLNKLLPELPGILNWSLAGWKRLTKRGHFIQPKAGAESALALSDLASPVSTFIRSGYEIGTDKIFKIRCAFLYVEWQGYCQAHGYAWTGDDASFGRDLKAAAPNVRRARMQVTNGYGKFRDYYYVGIKKSLEEGQAEPLLEEAVEVDDE